MKILHFSFVCFLLITFFIQLKAQELFQPLCTIDKMIVEEVERPANMPIGNTCFIATVKTANRTIRDNLYIGYHNCRNESTRPVHSLSITLCFGPDSCGPTHDPNTPFDNVYHIECGVTAGCREGCDVVIEGGGNN